RNLEDSSNLVIQYQASSTVGQFLLRHIEILKSDQFVKHKGGVDKTVPAEMHIFIFGTGVSYLMAIYKYLHTAKMLSASANWRLDDFDELVVSNDDVVLRNIAEDLRNRLPIEAMFTSEHQAIQKIHQHPLPMIHVDAFLYDDDVVDSLCEEGKMSRSYCTECGSYKTASLEFISHSFSLMELKFLYQHVLPDLTGKVVVDVGSRLGAVLFAGYLYSSASQLYGVEMNADFCQLQEMMITKYEFIDRIKVVHADICTQPSLLQKADVVVMNNVFEYFLDRQEQARKRGSLLVTVPSLEESLSKLQTDVQLSQWVEEVQLNYDLQCYGIQTWDYSFILAANGMEGVEKTE
ncbi:hypothetical protein IHE44_0013850, partial [Lamprotornis superbus]